MTGIETVLAISLIAGAATGLGALPIFIADRISHRVYDGMIALAAGVMLGASMFTLIIPGLEIGTMAEVIIGIVTGGLFLLLLNEEIPHIHTKFGGGNLTEYKRKAMLVGGSITLHNFPEGLAIGIAFGSGLEGVGLAVALAITVQNIPDGFAFSVPAEKAGLERLKNVFWTTISGSSSTWMFSSRSLSKTMRRLWWTSSVDFAPVQTILPERKISAADLGSCVR